MALEVLHNQANTHENEQFRRVVRIMDSVFDRLGYSGLLIGNPSNNLYSRFRADAILLYDHGAVIIDFKDYSGELILPHGDQEFKDSKWYAESASDRKAIEVKAGAHFLNPFRQLASYRSAFREIIENNPVLKHRINPSRICIANIFSGPLTITNKVPGCYPYYKIVQESSIGQFLYDQNNDNAYDEEIADTVKKIFPAKEYIRDFTYATETICLQDITVEDNAKDAIESFMKAESGDILVLASMEPSERDNLSKYIYSIADDYDIPEVYSLCHSARICRRLRQSGVSAYSLYSFIYGGAGNMETIEDEDNDIESGMQVVPLKADGDLDDRALFIIHEAHLVNRSLAQSDLLRFGSGRLLEDVLKFFNPDSRRKIVFIGDPYMLTFGSYEDSAMNMQCLKSLCGNRSVHYYCQPLKDTGANMKDKLRRSLASSIDAGLFNSLTYDYSDGSLAGADHDGIISLLRKWYGKPFSDEPDKAVLFYRKADCHKTNLWIKKDCLHNGRHIAPGDLLVAGNNIFIPDDTGFGNPERVLNGMYFTVLEIKDHYSYTTTPKGAEGQVTLSFTKARVSCLSLAEQSADIWILDNYLQSEDDLSKDEQIAMRIFINSRVSEAKARFPFRDSSFYERMKSDESYGQLDDKDRSDMETLISNKALPKENRIKVANPGCRQILRRYYSEYDRYIRQEVWKSDPMVNTLYPKYGWAITVHKALGATFEEVIIKGSRGEGAGYTNEDYFRWLYSGVTSSGNTLYINQPQVITPFTDCHVTNSSSQGAGSARPLLVYSDMTIPERYSGIIRLPNQNSAIAISRLSILLEQKGYLLEKTERCGEYLSKAFYSIPADTDSRLIVDFNNKGEKDFRGVSSVRMEPNPKVNGSVVEEAVRELFSDAGTGSFSVKSPDYIKEIYTGFISYFAGIGMNVKQIDSKDYQDVFSVESPRGTAKIRFWYGTSVQNHTKGFINKIEVFDDTDKDIYTEVKNYVSIRR